MLAWTLLFLIVALAFYGSSFGRITGHPVTDAKFMAAIFVALTLVSLFCIALSLKSACPTPDKSFNLECLRLLDLKELLWKEML